MTDTQRYAEAVAYIKSLPAFGSRPGLEGIRALLARMGEPQNRLQAVHVAGTNGKGSTCRMIASALSASGCRTGLYISPEVDGFTERIQIDGERIPPAAVARGADRIKTVCAAMLRAGLEQPAEFECITALALCWFAENNCDAVVLETGLGGRFDATNVFPAPLASVITSISMDHTKYLGDTPAKIAFEKAGIIKRGRPVICYPEQKPEAMEVIRARAKEEGAGLVIPAAGAARVISEDLGGSRFSYRGREYFTPLAGRHFLLNALTAIETLTSLRAQGFDIPDDAIAAGVAAPPFTARFETVCESPLVIIDGAHNPGAAEALCRNIDALLPGKRLAVVMGMFADKDCAGCIPAIAAKSSVFIATAPPSERALPASAAAELAGGAPELLCICPNPTKAVRTAMEFALGGRADAVICCGSFSFLGDIKRRMPEIRQIVTQ